MSPLLLVIILFIYQILAQIIGAGAAKKAATNGDKVNMLHLAGFYYAWQFIFQLIFVIVLNQTGVI